MLFFDMLQMDAGQLLHETNRFHQQERWATVQLLVRLAAVDLRELYVPVGYATMWDYCVGELHMSEEGISRRLWAARKCRDFPVLFDALADGRLHMTAVHLLATHLTAENVDDLIAASTHRSKAQIQEMLAERFPRPGVPTSFKPMSGGTNSTDAESSTGSHSLASVPVPTNAQEQTNAQGPLPPRTRFEPLNLEQVRVEFTMFKRVQDRLQYALDLLGTRVAPNDIGALLELLLELGIPVFEKQKFAATEQPRQPGAEASSDPRTIPAHVKRQVWERDGGQCTFTSASGKRCTCRRGVEFDHIKPVVLGGDASLDNIRLLCRKHNQLEADRKLGKKLMDSKRPAKDTPEPGPEPTLRFPYEDDIRAALTTLKCTRAEISIGLCASARLAPEATCEQRMKAALEALRKPNAKKLSFAKAPDTGGPS